MLRIGKDIGKRFLVEKQRQVDYDDFRGATRGGAQFLVTVDRMMMRHVLEGFLHTLWTPHSITIPRHHLPLQGLLIFQRAWDFWSLVHGGLACTLSLLNGYLFSRHFPERFPPLVILDLVVGHPFVKFLYVCSPFAPAYQTVTNCSTIPFPRKTIFCLSNSPTPNPLFNPSSFPSCSNPTPISHLTNLLPSPSSPPPTSPPQPEPPKPCPPPPSNPPPTPPIPSSRPPAQPSSLYSQPQPPLSTPQVPSPQPSA